MADQAALVGGFVLGIATGALSAYLGWNRSGEPFEARKFIDGVVTGGLVGAVVVFANLEKFETATSDWDVLHIYALIFTASLAVDYLREHLIGIVKRKFDQRFKALEEKDKAKATTTATTTTQTKE